MRSHLNTRAPMAHEVLGAVLQVREGTLQVLLWQRALEPHLGRWSLPGGRLRPDEDVETSIRRQLAEKVVGRDLGLPVLHLPQLLGLALGLQPKDLGLGKHVVKPTSVIDWREAVVAEVAA